MTQLKITCDKAKKTLKFTGDKIAVGEHCRIAIEGLGEVGVDNLRLRVLVNDETIARFPLEGQAWNEDLSCELNLNTVQAKEIVQCCAQGLFVLDDTSVPQLYGMGMCHLGLWPQENGEDVPYDLSGYPDNIEAFKTEIENFRARVEAAESAASAAESSAKISSEQSTLSAKSASQAASSASQAQASAQRAEAAVSTALKRQFVSALPAVGSPNIIYLVPSAHPVSGDERDEYMWNDAESKWEKIGSSATSVVLDDDVTETSENGVKSKGIWKFAKGLSSFVVEHYKVGLKNIFERLNPNGTRSGGQYSSFDDFYEDVKSGKVTSLFYHIYNTAEANGILFAPHSIAENEIIFTAVYTDANGKNMMRYLTCTKNDTSIGPIKGLLGTEFEIADALNYVKRDGRTSRNVNLSGDNETSFGVGTINSFASGTHNKVSGGRDSAAIGIWNEVDGTGSFALGGGNAVSGENSIAIGNNNTVDEADVSVVLGVGAKTSESQTLVWQGEDLDAESEEQDEEGSYPSHGEGTANFNPKSTVTDNTVVPTALQKLTGFFIGAKHLYDWLKDFLASKIVAPSAAARDGDIAGAKATGKMLTRVIELDEATKKLFLMKDGVSTKTEISSWNEFYGLTVKGLVRLYYIATGSGETGRKALYTPHLVDAVDGRVPAILFDATGFIGDNQVWTRTITMTKTGDGEDGGIHVEVGKLTEVAKKSDIPAVTAPASYMAFKNGKAADEGYVEKALGEKLSTSGGVVEGLLKFGSEHSVAIGSDYADSGLRVVFDGKGIIILPNGLGDGIPKIIDDHSKSIISGITEQDIEDFIAKYKGEWKIAGNNYLGRELSQGDVVRIYLKDKGTPLQVWFAEAKEAVGEDAVWGNDGSKFKTIEPTEGFKKLVELYEKNKAALFADTAFKTAVENEIKSRPYLEQGEEGGIYVVIPEKA